MNYPVYHLLLNQILSAIYEIDDIEMTRIHWEIDSADIEVGKGESYAVPIENYEILYIDITYTYELNGLVEKFSGTMKWNLQELATVRIESLWYEIKNIVYEFKKELIKDVKK